MPSLNLDTVMKQWKWQEK